MPKSFLVKKRAKSKVCCSDSEDENLYTGEQEEGKLISLHMTWLLYKCMHLSAVATGG
jgi:hypothetical protein